MTENKSATESLQKFIFCRRLVPRIVIAHCVMLQLTCCVFKFQMFSSSSLLEHLVNQTILRSDPIPSNAVYFHIYSSRSATSSQRIKSQQSHVYILYEIFHRFQHSNTFDRQPGEANLGPSCRPKYVWATYTITFMTHRTGERTGQHRWWTNVGIKCNRKPSRWIFPHWPASRCRTSPYTISEWYPKIFKIYQGSVIPRARLMSDTIIRWEQIRRTQTV